MSANSKGAHYHVMSCQAHWRSNIYFKYQVRLQFKNNTSKQLRKGDLSLNLLDINEVIHFWTDRNTRFCHLILPLYLNIFSPPASLNRPLEILKTIPKITRSVQPVRHKDGQEALKSKISSNFLFKQLFDGS